MKNKTTQKLKIIELEILRLIRRVTEERTKLFIVQKPLERINIEMRIASLDVRIEGYQDWKIQLENNQIKK